LGQKTDPVALLKALGKPVLAVLTKAGHIPREAACKPSELEKQSINHPGIGGTLFVDGLHHILCALRGPSLTRNPMTDGIAPSLITAPQAFPAILVGGLIVGVLDLTYAIVVYSPHRPILVPQTIASGLLGVKSYGGGAKTAALGVLLHFVIAVGAAGVYFLGSRRFEILLRRAVLFGLFYGALVYLFMHLIVLPLSAAPKGHAPLIYQACEFAWHWIGVGLPIALSVRHYSR